MWDQEVHAITASLSPNPLALSWMDRQLPTYPASNAAQSAKDLLRHLLQLDPQKREQRITDLRALVATEVRPSILDRHVSQYELNQYANIPCCLSVHTDTPTNPYLLWTKQHLNRS